MSLVGKITGAPRRNATSNCAAKIPSTLNTLRNAVAHASAQQLLQID
jgi:hypothetical protein